MVKFSTSVLIAAMAIAPILAAPVLPVNPSSGGSTDLADHPGPLPPHLQARGRFGGMKGGFKKSFKKSGSRKGKKSGFKKALKGVGDIIGSSETSADDFHSSLLQLQPQQRDLVNEEFLEARGRFGGFKSTAKVGGEVASGIGAVGTLVTDPGDIKSFAGPVARDLNERIDVAEREYEEFEAREESLNDLD